jgi:catechol 2,3-dioxygenase-like lactoylglutathione lyase family enzyme
LTANALPPIQQQVTFLHTTDLQAMHAFYGELLGLPLVLDQGPCRIYRAAGDAFLGFCTSGAVLQPADATNAPLQSVVLTLVSDAVDAWGAALQARGVALEKSPQLNATYNIYHLFVRDPDGRLVEIQQFLDPAWPTPASA